MANENLGSLPEQTSGASRGGKKRASNMTPEERIESARNAASARWSSERSLLKATHPGVLPIGDLELPCAVLEDGTRVLSERGVAGTLGGRRGGSHWRRKRSGSNLPVYISASNLDPYISHGEISLNG